MKIVNLTNCKKLKEIQGWENAQFLRIITLRGVPNIKFSENINQVLKASTLNFPIEFEGNLSNNETWSWIKFEENGSSSISFQWPPLISNLEFLGICIWVVVLVLEPFPTDCHIHYNSRIEKDGFRVWYRSRDSIRLSGVQLLKEGGNVVSFVDFIPRDCFKDIKAGEIFRVISNVEEVIPKFKYVEVVKGAKKGMTKKIRVEALYRDREDGFLPFLPLPKLDSNTEEEEDDYF
nr:TMV resistance protein N-like [Ipomoea batatas]